MTYENMNNNDDAQATRKAFIRTLMTADPNTRLPWNGRHALPHEILQEVFRGNSTVTVRPTQQQQPGMGGSVVPSQAAIDALSPERYAELSETGGIDGLTRPHPIKVTSRQGGTYVARLSINPETGAIEAGRPLDMTHFDAPEGHPRPWENTRY
jgi:hypothetical protein